MAPAGRARLTQGRPLAPVGLPGHTRGMSEKEDYDDPDAPKVPLGLYNLILIAVVVALLTARVVWGILAPPLKENT